MSSLSANHSLGGDPLCCNGNQEKRPLLRGEVPQLATTSVISRRDITSDGTTAIIQIPAGASERAEPRYKPEKLKTLLAFIFSSVCLIANLFVLAYVHERVPDRRKVGPLPDVFFDLLPVMDRALEVSEIIIIASVWTCILLMILHRYRWIVFRRVFIIMGSLYAMRAVTMLVTQVPIASTTYYCSPKANTTNPVVIFKRVLQLFSGFGLSINGQHTYCGDYIFSGHTLILTLCFLIIKEYSPQRCRILHSLYFCTSLFGVFCVLLARGHYTIDIILGYYVTTRVFWIYHSLCASQLSSKTHLSSQTATNYLSRVWWYPLFYYFEKTSLVLCLVSTSGLYLGPGNGCHERESPNTGELSTPGVHCTSSSTHTAAAAAAAAAARSDVCVESKL